MEWIRPDEYIKVYNNGTYRIYTYDRGTKEPGRKYGIKIKKVTPLKSNEYQPVVHFK